MDDTAPRVLTLRLRNPETYRMLELVARQREVSVNDVVQEALEEHLKMAAWAVEQQLSQALDVVRQYTSQDRERDIAAFARAEVSEEDPLRSTRVTLDDDPFGVRDAFMHPVE